MLTKSPISMALVVVAYNRSAGRIPVIERNFVASTAEWMDIYVCDNSDALDRRLMNYCEELGINYHWMGANKGLPKAYNTAISRIGEGYSFVCFFDQDTAFDEDYFRRVRRHLDSAKGDVFLPIVNSSTGLLSPCIATGPWLHEINASELIPNELPSHVSRYSWINSGMVIRREVLRTHCFDERLFLDFVDHQFSRELLKSGLTCRIMRDCTLVQEFSREADRLPSALHRFTIFKRDAKVFYSGDWLERGFCALLVSRRLISSCIRYHSIRFAWC